MLRLPLLLILCTQLLSVTNARHLRELDTPDQLPEEGMPEEVMLGDAEGGEGPAQEEGGEDFLSFAPDQEFFGGEEPSQEQMSDQEGEHDLQSRLFFFRRRIPLLFRLQKRLASLRNRITLLRLTITTAAPTTAPTTPPTTTPTTTPPPTTTTATTPTTTATTTTATTPTTTATTTTATTPTTTATTTTATTPTTTPPTTTATTPTTTPP